MGFYPKLRYIEACKSGDKCACCDGAAIGTAVVAFTCLRSQDERYAACTEHVKLARVDIDAFLAATEAWGIANAR